MHDTVRSTHSAFARRLELCVRFRVKGKGIGVLPRPSYGLMHARPAHGFLLGKTRKQGERKRLLRPYSER